MNILRAVALLAFVAGVGVLVYGLAFSSSEKEKPTFFDQTPAQVVDTPTPLPTNAPTPTPTPPPFNGRVARMKIPSLGIDYPIEELGVKANNELDTPHGYWTNIGWYNIEGYAKPGFLGNAFFSAHVNYEGKDGPFAKLAKANKDDEIDIQMADGGPMYRYRIFKKQRYDVATIDMGALIWPKEKPEGTEWITLMTCSCQPGRFILNPGSQFGECLDRDVVVASRIS